ncbi:MAG: RidA family protein [Sedimentisphaerales bacterium]|nr:RidA family protein [Sedimentisphaerales bacterium]
MKGRIIITFVLAVLACCYGCNSPSITSYSAEEKLIGAKLSDLGIELPEIARPVAAYVNVVQSGKLLFVAGQLPIREGRVLCTGKVGRDVDLEKAQEAARLCVINALVAIKDELGSLGRVRRIVRVEVFVNSAQDFTGQSQVANGASILLQQVFDDAGKHARMAVGVAELPLDAAVEVAMIVERK